MTTNTATDLVQTLTALAAPDVDLAEVAQEWASAGFTHQTAMAVMAVLFEDGEPIATGCTADELSPYGDSLRPLAVAALLRGGLATALRAALAAPENMRNEVLEEVWGQWAGLHGASDRITAGINAEDPCGPIFGWGTESAAAMLLAAADKTGDPDGALEALAVSGPTAAWAAAVEAAAKAAGGDPGWVLLRRAGLYEPVVRRVEGEEYRRLLVDPADCHETEESRYRWSYKGRVVTGVARRLHAAMKSLRSRSSVSVELTPMGDRSSGFGDRDYYYHLVVRSEFAQLGTARAVEVEGVYAIHKTVGGAVQFGAAIDDELGAALAGLVVRTTGADGLGMTEFHVGQNVLDALGLGGVVTDALIKERIDADNRPVKHKPGEVMALDPESWVKQLDAALGGDTTADVMFVADEDGTFLLRAGWALTGPGVLRGRELDVIPSEAFASYLEPESLGSTEALAAEIAKLPWSSITAVIREDEK